MTVSQGTLDGLVGVTYTPDNNVFGVTVENFTSAMVNGTLTIPSITVVTTGAPGAGLSDGIGETEKFTSVNDTKGDGNLDLLDNGTSYGSFVEYVDGFSASAVLLAGVDPNDLAGQLNDNLSPLLDVISTTSLAPGTVLTLTSTGVFNPGSGSSTSTGGTQNIVPVSGTGNVPSAISGDDNIEVVSGAAAGAVIDITAGYQEISISGAAAVTLVDSFGDVLLVGGSGNTTLLAAASGDTLQGGAGNNVIVSFTGGALETDAGNAGSNLFYGGQAAVTIQGGSGHDTAVMSHGGAYTTGGGGSQAWLGSGTAVITSNGADTIVASTGATTVNAMGASGDLVFGGSVSLFFNASTGSNTVVGVNASVTVNGGTGGGVFYGGTAGNNLLASGGGNVVMVGGGSGDLLLATGAGSVEMEASGGAETLNGSGSSGSDAFFGGAGSDCIVGGTGANAFTAGPGNMTLVGGGSSDLYVFLAGATSQTVIEGFNPAHDFIHLNGFASGAAQAALAGETSSAAGTVITLTDGTHITFAGTAPSAISLSNFV